MEIRTQKKLDYLEETKTLIKEALIEKGQDVSDSDTFRSYADKILNISGGGGSGSAVVWFVSFMGADGSLLFKMPVLDGDDCKNPVTHGDITTPTKESTAQYNYTYSGWSLTEGGTADTTNALAKVTEDRTVYAAFTSAVRYYTVTYYDSDGTTVLKTESLAYGATPSYAPTKGDYILDVWNPDSPVTGDMSYTAVWKLKATFTTASWAEIKEICDSGNAASIFEVGQEKTETITYADGTSEEVTWVIADFGNRKTGRSPRTDASMVVMSKYALATKQYWNTYGSTQAYYDTSAIDTYLNSTVLNALSEELQNIITKGYVDDWDSRALWLPDLYQLGFTKDDCPVSVDDAYIQVYDAGQTEFAIFANGESLVKTRVTDGAAVDYWLGTFTNYGSSWNCLYIKADGTLAYNSIGGFGQAGVVPCFCI